MGWVAWSASLACLRRARYKTRVVQRHFQRGHGALSDAIHHAPRSVGCIMVDSAATAVPVARRSPLIQVASFVDIAQADTAQAILGLNGIESWQENATVVHLQWLYSNAVGGIKLFVANEDAESARTLLTEQTATPEQAIESHCESCGETLPPGWDVCWRCSFTAEPVVQSEVTLPESANKGDPFVVAISVVVALLLVLYLSGPWVFLLVTLAVLGIRLATFGHNLLEPLLHENSCPIENLTPDSGESKDDGPDYTIAAARAAMFSMLSFFCVPFLIRSTRELYLHRTTKGRLNRTLVWLLIWIVAPPYLFLGWAISYYLDAIIIGDYRGR